MIGTCSGTLLLEHDMCSSACAKEDGNIDLYATQFEFLPCAHV